MDTQTKVTHVDTGSKTKEDLQDPYQNFQGLGSLTDKIKDEDDMTPHEIEFARGQNMTAKQAEINKPGNFTPKEAALIKQGLDPAKQAEVDAQTVEDSTDKDVVYKDKQLSDINTAIDNLMKDPKIGKNEKRGQLQNLRNRVLELMTQMDRGLL